MSIAIQGLGFPLTASLEDAGADLYAVIDRVAERAGRNAAKRVDRLHENVRLARPKPLRSLPGEASDMSNN